MRLSKQTSLYFKTDVGKRNEREREKKNSARFKKNYLVKKNQVLKYDISF